MIRASWAPSRPARSTVYLLTAVVAAAASFVTAVVRPDSGSSAGALDGESLFRTKGCATCHDGPDSNSMTGVGPQLSDAVAWAGDRVDGLNAEEYLAQSMRSPSAFISPEYRSSGGPGDSMPLLQLSDDEVDALVDYLLGRV